MAFRDGPRGIGGWLGFFLITLGVIGPLRILINTYGLFADPRVAAAYGDRWTMLGAAEAVLIVLNLGALAFLVWRFFAYRTWQTVRICIVGIWLLPIVVTVLETLVVTLIGGIPAGPLMMQMLPDLFQALIYATIWTAYLLRSVRVANTYPREDADGAELAEVFE
jgi:uncharacterized membrane protein (UPF0182 family)